MESPQGFVAAIKRCSQSKDLGTGQSLHHQALLAGFHANKFVSAALVSMYGKCQSMAIAKLVFDEMPHGQRDVVVWNALILGFVDNGHSSVAMDLLGRMDCSFNSYTFVAAIKACSCLVVRGDQSEVDALWIHDRVKAQGLESNLAVATSLIGLFGKCGRMDLAREVFARMVDRDVVTWNTLILGYVESRDGARALETFRSMDHEPSCVSFLAAIKACSIITSSKREFALETGIAIHKMAMARIGSSNLDVELATSLIDFYSGCKCLQRAREVFHAMPWKNVVAWNCIIFGCVENGESLRALEMFDRMDCPPTSVSYIAALKACSCLGSGLDRQLWLQRGILIHSRVRERGMDSLPAVANTLVDMYCRCGSLQLARDVFDAMIERDVVSWNNLIFGHLENGEYSTAMDLFERMDCEKDCITFVAALKACGRLAFKNKDSYIRRGICIHKKVRELGHGSNLLVATALVEMYIKCGNLALAREVFDSSSTRRDVVAWTTMILGYVENGEHRQALELFASIDCQPDPYAYAAALKACEGLSREESLKQATSIHKQTESLGLASNTVVATSLVHVYSRCGKMDIAKSVFDGMIVKDVQAWTSLILGYAKNGQSQIALEIFSSMDCDPDPLTYAASLEASVNLAAAGLAAGRDIHARVCKLGIEQDQIVSTSLMNFYNKCGSTSRAQEIFDSVHSPSSIHWNTLISGCSSRGDALHVLRLAGDMRDSKVGMDGVTLVSILATCSHAGLIDQGLVFFKSRAEIGAGVSLSVEHYSCIVDMLGRANRLEEALHVVRSMPLEASAVIWRSLLGASRNWKNLKVGEAAFEALEKAGEKKAADYVLMSDIYASV